MLAPEFIPGYEQAHRSESTVGTDDRKAGKDTARPIPIVPVALTEACRSFSRGSIPGLQDLPQLSCSRQ
ncbi:MAG: hypothetical protein ACFCU6_06065 [Balneolaceae bacterium]